MLDEIIGFFEENTFLVAIFTAGIVIAIVYNLTH